MESLFTRVCTETGWKSASRISGEACERFVCAGFACPRCRGPFARCPTNTPSQDMMCTRCAQRFQIKATKRDRLPSTLLGGAYHTTRKNLNQLDFLVVLYPRGNVYHMPHERIRREMVMPRKTLSSNARRAGWQGCTLRFHINRYKRVVPNIGLRWGLTRPRTKRWSRHSRRRTTLPHRCPLCTTDM